MSDDVKNRVQQQFGAAASAYVTSDIHAQGESLAVLIEGTKPQPHWHVIDVATGAGHTALAFAPHVEEVIAFDLTEGMLRETRKLAESRSVANIQTKIGDAENLPFPDSTFDLVTCRLAFHHFPNPDAAIREIARVLRPGGVLGFTDNVTVEDSDAAARYNAYEKLRDPSHYWVSSAKDLIARFERAGLAVRQTKQLTKEFEFHAWADRQHVSDIDKEKLLEMMRTIPAALHPLFQPRWTDQTMYFSLWELVVIATKQESRISP